MIIIGFVIAAFFIIMICLICRGYLEDIIELEKRVLQLEKRITDSNKRINKIEEDRDLMLDYYERVNVIETIQEKIYKHVFKKEGDETMACKKGKGGRRK